MASRSAADRCRPCTLYRRNARVLAGATGRARGDRDGSSGTAAGDSGDSAAGAAPYLSGTFLRDVGVDDRYGERGARGSYVVCDGDRNSHGRPGGGGVGAPLWGGVSPV